jgi:hypothetical protein
LNIIANVVGSEEKCLANKSIKAVVMDWRLAYDQNSKFYHKIQFLKLR